jgi:hypothetical protein
MQGRAGRYSSTCVRYVEKRDFRRVKRADDQLGARRDAVSFFRAFDEHIHRLWAKTQQLTDDCVAFSAGAEDQALALTICQSRSLSDEGFTDAH